LAASIISFCRICSFDAVTLLVLGAGAGPEEPRALRVHQLAG
jgi:hypothetical protein